MNGSMIGRSFALALVLMGALAAGIGCGPGAEWIDDDSPECIPGAGECGGTEICVREQCEAIDGQKFFLNVESGEFSIEERFYVEVRERGSTRLLRTESSAKRNDPRWYEETVLTVENRSDYWTLEVWYEGWWGDHHVMGCRLDFEPSLFEKEQQLICREGGQKLNFSLEPFWTL